MKNNINDNNCYNLVMSQNIIFFFDVWSTIKTLKGRERREITSEI